MTDPLAVDRSIRIDVLLLLIARLGCLVWLGTIHVTIAIGVVNLFRFFSSAPTAPVSPRLPLHRIPHITIIRPVKNIEAELYHCIASSFRQDYPRERLSIRLCVAHDTDPALPILEKVIADFPGFDARLLVQSCDPLCSGLQSDRLGPNPKIRNVSRAYKEAGEGDIIWMIDCNVWVAPHVAGRMVDKLLGMGSDGKPTTPYKLVHMVPLVVDLPLGASNRSSSSILSKLWNHGGGRLDEMFMATTHAKFYTAFNYMALSPCLLGKSNMFRKSHLEIATDPQRNHALRPSPLPRLTGLDHFSFYICEDHLIGDVLWQWNLPGFAHHGLLMGDLAIQPVRDVSVPAYFARRVRWLRARKWTVLLATYCEPGVESLLSGLYFAFALSSIPGLDPWPGIPGTWRGFAALWSVYIIGWCLVDWVVFRLLHALPSTQSDITTPAFARGLPGSRRSLTEWLIAWAARECLALPIWMWSFYLPSVISWRGNKFKAATDMTIRNIPVSTEMLEAPVLSK